MSRAIPCKGFPSRTAAVMALRERGLSRRDVARHLDLTGSQVAALEVGAKSDKSGRVAIPIVVHQALASHAAARGISTYDLIRQIVCTVVNERLVDSVLDDQPERIAA